MSLNTFTYTLEFRYWYEIDWWMESRRENYLFLFSTNTPCEQVSYRCINYKIIYILCFSRIRKTLFDIGKHVYFGFCVVKQFIGIFIIVFSYCFGNFWAQIQRTPLIQWLSCFFFVLLGVFQVHKSGIRIL